MTASSRHFAWLVISTFSVGLVVWAALGWSPGAASRTSTTIAWAAASQPGQEAAIAGDSRIAGAHPASTVSRGRSLSSKSGGRTTKSYGSLLYKKLLKPLFRLTLFIAIGLFIGNLIEALQWTQHLGRITRPLLRWGRLNDHSAVAFMAAFFSGVTANTMLVNAYNDDRISRKELFYTNILNTLPSYFLHLPTTFFILLPMVRQAGVLYLACTLSAAMVRALAVLTTSRCTLPAPDSDTLEGPGSHAKQGIWKDTWRKFRLRFRRILVWTVPIYTLFFFINQLGIFDWLETTLTRFFTLAFVPVEALSIIAFQVMAEFTAGVAAAGAMLDAGTLSIKQTVIVLLIGNIISSPVRALRHQLPYYMGIYTPRLGFNLALVSQLVRTSSVILALLLFYWLYPGG